MADFIDLRNPSDFNPALNPGFQFGSGLSRGLSGALDERRRERVRAELLLQLKEDFRPLAEQHLNQFAGYRSQDPATRMAQVESFASTFANMAASGDAKFADVAGLLPAGSKSSLALEKFAADEQERKDRLALDRDAETRLQGAADATRINQESQAADRKEDNRLNWQKFAAERGDVFFERVGEAAKGFIDFRQQGIENRQAQEKLGFTGRLVAVREAREAREAKKPAKSEVTPATQLVAMRADLDTMDDLAVQLDVAIGEATPGGWTNFWRKVGSIVADTNDPGAVVLAETGSPEAPSKQFLIDEINSRLHARGFAKLKNDATPKQMKDAINRIRRELRRIIERTTFPGVGGAVTNPARRTRAPVDPGDPPNELDNDALLEAMLAN